MSLNTLNQLPAPTIIDPLDFETIYQQIKTDILALAPELEEALNMESEPANKLAQAFAYRILHERKLANDQALSMMLAKGFGAQLDHLGMLPFIKTARHQLTPEDTSTTPATPAIWEDDESYRMRLHQSLDGISTAGPIGAYIYHALAASGEVKDVAVDNPSFSRDHDAEAALSQRIVLQIQYSAALADPRPGDVAITILSNEGDGTASDALLLQVQQYLSADNIRPLTDRPIVRSALIVPYQIDAQIWLYANNDAQIILQTINQRLAQYQAQYHSIGSDIVRSAIISCIHVAGVQRVNLLQPADALSIASHEAAFCDGLNLDVIGVAL
jgi:phage-related baseplate assembly protein